MICNQQQQLKSQQNTSPVHYPPSIPSTTSHNNSNNAINYTVSPSKTPQITVKPNKSLLTNSPFPPSNPLINKIF
jgi:hypothetical protein